MKRHTLRRAGRFLILGIMGVTVVIAMMARVSSAQVGHGGFPKRAGVGGINLPQD